MNKRKVECLAIQIWFQITVFNLGISHIISFMKARATKHNANRQANKISVHSGRRLPLQPRDTPHTTPSGIVLAASPGLAAAGPDCTPDYGSLRRDAVQRGRPHAPPSAPIIITSQSPLLKVQVSWWSDKFLFLKAYHWWTMLTLKDWFYTVWYILMSLLCIYYMLWTNALYRQGRRYINRLIARLSQNM